MLGTPSVVRGIVGLLVAVASQSVSQAAPVGSRLLQDDFARFAAATPDLGQVPGTSYSWVLRLPLRDGKPVPVIQGRDGALVVGYSSGDNPHDTGVVPPAAACGSGAR